MDKPVIPKEAGWAVSVLPSPSNNGLIPGVFIKCSGDEDLRASVTAHFNYYSWDYYTKP